MNVATAACYQLGLVAAVDLPERATSKVKFRKDGADLILVDETALNVQLLSQSMGDIAAVAELGKTKRASELSSEPVLSFFPHCGWVFNAFIDHRQLTLPLGPSFEYKS